MKKLQNNTLQQFIDNLIEELKNENVNRLYHKEKELNIPFIISSLYQSFENDDQNTYNDFISDLNMYPHYDISFNEPIDDLYSIIDVDILFSYNLNTDQDIPYYSYRICFSYDERLYGYCECTPDMPDYREDKGCFGHAGDIFSDEQKLMLDDMHKRKIDMADEIFVINVGGYIGESTKSEIEYAKKHNKKVNYLDNINNDIRKETLKGILNKIPCEKNCQCCLRDGILSCFKPQKEGYIIGGLVEYITEELMNE